MSDLHKEASQELTFIRVQHNERRFAQLNGLLTSFSASTWTYLLTVNGGAAAGILAFIGAKNSVAVQSWPYIALTLFVIGLICVGVGHAAMVHKAQSLIDNWNLNIVRYWNNEISWKLLIEYDQTVVKKFEWVPWVLGWAAFGLFLAGVTVTALNFHRMASPT